MKNRQKTTLWVHETWQRNASLEYLFQRQRLKLGGVSQQFNRIYINVTTLIQTCSCVRVQIL